MAAAAFWRYPPGDPTRAGDGVFATVSGMIPASTSTGDSVASNSGTSTQTNGGDTIFTMSALGTVQFVDLDNPGPPAPVGNYAISVNTTNSVQFLTTGSSFGVFNSLGSGVGGTHNYGLEDDGTGILTNPATTLTEHWHVNYAPPARDAIPVMAASVTTGSGAYTVAGGTDGITGLTINGGTTITAGSGTYTTMTGTVVSYSVTTTDVDLSVASPIGALPFAVVVPDAGAVAWPVTVASSVGGPALSDPRTAGMMSVSTHYDAHF